MSGTNESSISKILLAIFSAALGVAGSVIVFQVTEKEPHLTTTITRPSSPEFPENKIVQFLTIRSDGQGVAKSVRLSLKSMQGRLYENEFKIFFSPIHTDPALPPQCDSSGDCVLQIGDLQPRAFSTVKLTYKRPPLTEGDIDTFSDNAQTEKIEANVASQEANQ
jgi:hypothetical protein